MNLKNFFPFCFQKRDFKYSDLSSREQKKIIKKSIKDANDEQLNLVKNFDRRFKKSIN